MSIRFVVALIAVPTLCAVAGAQTSLKVSTGWGGKDRAGRWNPVLVRLSDPMARNVTLQVVAPDQGGFATVIEEHVAIGPTAATFELVAPTHYSAWQRRVIVLRDASTERIIGQFPRRIRGSPDVPAVGPQQLFIGVTGRRAGLEQAMTYLGGQSGYLPPGQVPRSALGFDSLEVLFLNQPDLRELDREQQQAMLDWVRSGGSLLFVPGDNPIPRDSLLAGALPCRIGDVQRVDLSDQVLKEADLLPRFAHLSGRALEALPAAHRLQLLKGSSIAALSARYGLGRIMVVPVDLAGLEFEGANEKPATLRLWQPIVQRLIALPKPPEKLTYSSPYYGYQSESDDQQREGAATATLCDFLIPSAGGGWRWGRLALIALVVFFVVGPLDSLVLKAVGRTPWTWTTLPGWMGLAALAAALGSTLFAAGPATVRSVRLIDQVDEVSVATDLMGIESPRGTTIQVGGRARWWEPVVPGGVGASAPGRQGDLQFHQTDRSCQPEQIELSAGRPRFLRSQSERIGPPMIRASLALTTSPSDGPPRLVGTIENLSDTTVKNLRVRTAYGVVVIPLDAGGRLQPRQEVKVNLFASGEPFAPAQFEGRYQNYGYFGSRVTSTSIAEADLWAVVPDLSGRRALRIDGLMENDSALACIHAQCVDPPAPAEFKSNVPPKTACYQWIRALVRLAR